MSEVFDPEDELLEFGDDGLGDNDLDETTETFGAEAFTGVVVIDSAVSSRDDSLDNLALRARLGVHEALDPIRDGAFYERSIEEL